MEILDKISLKDWSLIGSASIVSSIISNPNINNENMWDYMISLMPKTFFTLVLLFILFLILEVIFGIFSWISEILEHHSYYYKIVITKVKSFISNYITKK